MKDWTPRETLEFIEWLDREDPRDFMDDETIREYEAMKRKSTRPGNRNGFC